MLNFPDHPVTNQIYLSWQWDGAKWGAAVGIGSVNTINPPSGSTIVLFDMRPVYISNTGTLASLTILLPEGVVDSRIEIGFLSPVTSLHIQDVMGAVVPTAPTSAYGPGAALVFRYVDPAIKWVYWK